MVHMLLPAMDTDTSQPGPPMADNLLQTIVTDTDTSLPGPLMMVDMLLPAIYGYQPARSSYEGFDPPNHSYEYQPTRTSYDGGYAPTSYGYEY